MIKFIMAICILGFCSFTISAKDSLEYATISNIMTFEHLADQSYLLIDSNNSYTVDDIIDIKLPSAYLQPSDEIPYMDFTRSTFWMRFNLENISDVDQDLYIELARPVTNEVDLYIYDKWMNQIKIHETGDEHLFSERPFLYRKFIFPVTIKKGEKRKFIAKLRSDGEVLSLPIKIWNRNYFTEYVSSENFFMGMFYGLLLFVIILFSFFGFALKQKLYAFFVSYVIFVVLMQLSLDGLSFQFLWPNYPWWANHAVVILVTLSVTALLIYVRIFLDFKKKHKIYIGVYNIFFLLLFICFILAFTSGKLYAFTFPFINLLAFLSSFLFFVGIYLKYKEEGKINIYFALAFFSVLLGGVVFILCNLNILGNEFLLNNALKMGSGIEVIFLSIAMAAQYSEIKKSEEMAQKQSLINIQKLNELRGKQNIILEKKVRERTQELKNSNDKLSNKNNEIIQSITYAQRLQDAVLPTQKNLDQLFPKSFVIHLPKDIVSGDFYWIEKINKDTFFAVADCTGHGVPGAMVSVLGYNSLNRCINEFKLSQPAQILDKLTQIIENTFDYYDKGVPDGMDIALCKWDGKKLEYSGANNPLYLIRNNEILEWKADKQPIGDFSDRKAFANHVINLEPDDIVYLSTDGYADQFGGPNDKKFLYGRFKKLLLNIHLKPPQEQKEILEKEFNNWKGTAEQIDDVCILGVLF